MNGTPVLEQMEQALAMLRSERTALEERIRILEPAVVGLRALTAKAHNWSVRKR